MSSRQVVTSSKYFRDEDILTLVKRIPVGATDMAREVYIRGNNVSAALFVRHMKACAFFNQAFDIKTDIGSMSFLSSSEF